MAPRIDVGAGEKVRPTVLAVTANLLEDLPGQRSDSQCQLLVSRSSGKHRVVRVRQGSELAQTVSHAHADHFEQVDCRVQNVLRHECSDVELEHELHRGALGLVGLERQGQDLTIRLFLEEFAHGDKIFHDVDGPESFRIFVEQQNDALAQLERFEVTVLPTKRNGLRQVRWQLVVQRSCMFQHLLAARFRHLEMAEGVFHFATCFIVLKCQIVMIRPQMLDLPYGRRCGLEIGRCRDQGRNLEGVTGHMDVQVGRENMVLALDAVVMIGGDE
mmetsp:Transcript_24733/g.69444  ORF Transcript_24733/g.69444 Transcript_24733/m.69444 type:complete len:273 (-) Transcript_24733:2089-2907(-)